MKLRTLFLTAFGPFTGAALDFSGPANLHLVYGANEAGKSSALRAITDLRYGIPMRSKDDFVHEFKDMLLAGCFEDVAGRSIGLARRKGNKDPLMHADTATGAPQAGAPVAPEVQLALTGGVGREQFETMYGLDSDCLRKSGKLLVQGEGELGAALFEASTGSAGIKAMLQTLQADARKFFVPRGQLPILNEAARQLDEARQRYKQAVTKPDQWKVLKRGHDEAQQRLAAVRAQLADQRRRLAELAELRAVAPLLRELELAEARWADVQGHVALPPEARQCRQAAQQRQALSQIALAEADEALALCRQSLQALKMDASLLSHAPVIDRLDDDVALLRRERNVRLTLQSATADTAQQLALQAGRMAQAGDARIDSLEAFFAQTPSAAAQAELAQLLEEAQALNSDEQHATEGLASMQRKLAQLQAEGLDEPSPALQQVLVRALRPAQALADAPARLADAQQAIESEQRKLERCLADLGLQTSEQLVHSRWLPAAEMDTYERERAESLRCAAQHESQQAQLQIDLAVQQHRRQALGASGEVVTAETLRQARQARDARWQTLRAAFIDLPHGSGTQGQAHDDSAASRTPAGRGLPEQFEHSQAQADRQADLLREGAQRAAEVAECEQRIAEMTQSLSALQVAQAAQAQALSALDENWHQALQRLEIPTGSAATVREWLALRQTALERSERLLQSRQAQAQLQRQVDAARGQLLAALVALAPVAGMSQPDDSEPLQSLLALGTAAERDLLQAQAAMQRRKSDIASLSHDIAHHQAKAAALASQRQACRQALDAHCRVLGLGEGAASGSIKARLAELQRWINDYRLHGAQLQQLKAMQAGEVAVAHSAQALGELLGEPVGPHLDAWLDGLTQRLAQSREAQAQQANLQNAETQEQARRQRALDELKAAAGVLQALAEQAQVTSADELPEAESRSDAMQGVSIRLQDLNEQLARTSQKSAASLRAELAGLDSVALDAEKQACAEAIARLEAEEGAAIDSEQAARAALARIDTSDEAAQAREEMEAAIARYRAGVRPWAQLKLAEALLGEALRRHREKAQGPVLALAGDYFRLMTGGRFVRLLVDTDQESPVLLAQPAQGAPMPVGAMSEGTADQLYLALRLAALELQRQPDRMMPLVLDDVFMTADDERAAHMLRALEKFAATAQVLVFTHHHHLLDIATKAVAPGALRLHRLESRFGQGV
ncbi:MAG: AAA family ATPase [Polaromonas sp.]